RARAVRTEEAHHVAGADLDRDVIHHPAPPEGLVQRFGAQERRTAAVHGEVAPAGACAGAPLSGVSASTRAWSSRFPCCSGACSPSFLVPSGASPSPLFG